MATEVIEVKPTLTNGSIDNPNGNSAANAEIESVWVKEEKLADDEDAQFAITADPFIIVTESKPHKCDICHKVFCSKSNLTTHKRIHTGEKPYQCEVCLKQFSQQASLTGHKRRHTGERPFKCDICDKRFTFKSNLDEHLPLHTEAEKLYECDICHKRFNNSRYGTKHRRTHTDERAFECSVCLKLFAAKKNLADHMRTHTGEKPFQCDICHKLFTYSGDCKKHRFIHTGERPYACDVCHKQFTKSGDLKQHARLHTDERPYSCDICQRRFNHNGDLTKHRRTHTGEKPYGCDICHKRFSRKNILNMHVIKSHSIEIIRFEAVIYLVTYNVGTAFPTEDLRDLLSLNSVDDSPPSHLPDLYIVGLQEVRARPYDFIFEELAGFGEAWTEAFQLTLHSRNYVLFQTVRLQGILLLAFCLRGHLMRISDLEANYTRTGLNGYWGNKGALSVRFNFSGCTLCFVNVHLSAHENRLQSRINDFKMIIADQRFDSTRDILGHNYVFWLGDLNFRFSKDCTKSFKDIEALILDNRLNLLVQYDELKQVMLTKKAFHQFTERFPTFPPTFKFKIGTSNYNSKRRPAWTDRILYKTIPKHEVKTFEVKHIDGSYVSHDKYVASDHKPVASEFIIKIPSGIKTDSVSNNTRDGLMRQEAVTFDNIEFLWNDEENTFTFTVNSSTIDIETAQNDWIGVLPATFTNYNQYITYEYVKNLKINSAKSVRNKNCYGCTFPNLPFSKFSSNNLCFVYFQRTKWHFKDNIKGISKPFYVKTRQEIFYTNLFL